MKIFCLTLLCFSFGCSLYAQDKLEAESPLTLLTDKEYAEEYSKLNEEIALLTESVNEPVDEDIPETQEVSAKEEENLYEMMIYMSCRGIDLREE